MEMTSLCNNPKGPKAVLLFLFLFAPLITLAQSEIIYSPSITSFLTGIDSVQTQFNLDMNNGVFYKEINKQQIYLKINPNTNSRTELVLTNDAITKLVYKFSTPLIFKDADNLNCSGVYLSGISIINNEIKLAYTVDDHRSCRRVDDKIIKNLTQFFNLPGQLADFLKGGMGPKNAAIWTDCTNNFRILETSRNIINRITILPNDGQNNRLVFKGNRKLVFSDSQEYDNYMLIGQGNQVVINDLQSDVETGNLSFNMSFQFNSVQSCKIQSKGIDLTLPQPVFKNFTVNLNSSGGETKQLLVNAGINSPIAENSVIKVEGSKSSSSFNIGKGSSLSVPNLSMAFSGKNKAIVKLGLGTSLTLKLQNSDVSLNNYSTVHVNSGSIGSTSLAAEFYSDRSETYWQGTIRDIDFEVDGGTIALNENSQMNIKAGRLLSDVLNVDNTINPQLTGRFTKFQLFFTDNNTFACTTNGFKFNLAANCFVSQADDDPVRSEKDEQYPLGTLEYHLAFSKFSVNGLGQLTLNNGMFECNLKNIGKEQFSARDVKFNGQVDVTVKDKTISTAVELRGRLDFSRQIGPDFIGYANFTLNPLKESAVVTTDCKNDSELDWNHVGDKHIFPVKIELNLARSIALNNIRFEVKKGMLQPFASQTAGAIKINIPQGYGEYDGDNLGCDNIASNIHNEDRGDDDIKKLQEVLRGTVNRGFNCTFHLWAVNKTYTVPFTMNFEYHIAEGTLKPAVVLYPKIDLRSLDVEYIKHGCDDPATEFILGLFVDIKQKIKENVDKKLSELSDKFSQTIVIKAD